MTEGGSTKSMLLGTAGSPPPRSSGWPICGSPRPGRHDQSPKARAAARQAVSAPVVARLSALWQHHLSRIWGKSKLAEAIRHAVARREILARFLKDGLIEPDFNIAERAIGPQTITRKNSLSAGSDGGGRTWAAIATLLHACKMNNVDPAAWLTTTLQRIADQWPSAEIDALMPWNYQR